MTMYRIIKADDGAVIGSTEKPVYIYRKSTGSFVQTDEQNAQGVAWKGTPYNLRDREGVGAEETVIVIEFDGAEATADTAEEVSDLDGLTVDHEYRLTLLELGLADEI